MSWEGGASGAAVHRQAFSREAALEARPSTTMNSMRHDKVDLTSAFAKVSEHWRPKIIAELNGQEVKVVKIKGEFVWHHHDVEDELFLIHKGKLRMEFRDRTVTLGPGECIVVPHGVEHRPVAEEEVELILFEPAGVHNTGNVEHPTLTAPDGVKL